VVGKMEIDIPFILKFKNLEYIFDLIKKKAIYLNNPSKFNDPLDSFLITMFGTDKTSMPLSLHEYIDISANIAIFCGSKIENLKNVLMWAHYSDFHRGVALKYRIPAKVTGIFRPVNYDPHDHEGFINVLNGKYMTTEDKENAIIDSIFLKNSAWKYEQELRYVRKLNKTELPMEYNWPIEELYLGCKFLENDDEKLEEIIRIVDLCLELKIRIYTMEYYFDSTTKRFTLTHQEWIENENCMMEENYYRIQSSILQEMKKRTLNSPRGRIISEIARDVAKEEIDRKLREEIMKINSSIR
jgi:hypothetical protein